MNSFEDEALTEHKKDLILRNSFFREMLAEHHPSRMINKSDAPVTNPTDDIKVVEVIKFPDLKNPYFEPVVTPNRSARLLITQVAERHGLRFTDIVGDKRNHKILPARLEAMKLIYDTYPNWVLSSNSKVIQQRPFYYCLCN